ncbi:tetratricopeptide repeat protein [Alphaproteobacteria bacterium]|nr:tetratricopeptide repeat protein [Alphaproteobacteria bacterium]
MSINNLFEKGNKFFLLQNHIAGLEIYKKILFKYPKNIRLGEEIKKKVKKFKISVPSTFSQNQIDNFFALHNAGKTNLVIQTLYSFLETNPNNILSISLLGTFLGINEEYDKAIKFQKLAIEKAPFEVVFYINLSETLSKINKLEESLSILYFAKVLSLTNNVIDYKLAKIYTELKNYSKADFIYQGLIKEDSISNELIYSYCNNLIKFNKEKEALSFLEKYELENSEDEQIKILIGLTYFKMQEFNLAKDFFYKVLKLNNDNDEAHTMLGDTYEKLGDLDLAKTCYDHSLTINPNNISTINNLAAWHFIKGDMKEAEKLYNFSLTKNKNNSNTRYFLSLCQLAQSNYSEGWLNFDYRWLSNEYNSLEFKSNLAKFKLNDNKKNLLLWGEQGVGDQILFMRFLKDIQLHVDNLFINIDKRLHPLIKRSFPEILFFNKDTSTYLDCQLSFGDLAGLFVKDNSYFLNNQNHYISSDPVIKERLEASIKSKNRFLCGISWISKTDEIGINKSITLEILKPVLNIENIEFIDLQYSDTSIERENFYNKNNIKIKKIENIDNFNDLNGLSSLIDVCDFVITISNTNAHIAGSLGKKTFLLLPHGKGRLWYWTSKKGRSVWYPKIEIIEQEHVGNWQPVIKELEKKVKEHLIE